MMRWRKSSIDGTFGDRTVLLTTGVVDRPRKAALLFHGVHSSSGSDPGNKYARIGIFQGDRLFYTFESAECPLDIKALNTFIESNFR